MHSAAILYLQNELQVFHCTDCDYMIKLFRKYVCSIALGEEGHISLFSFMGRLWYDYWRKKCEPSWNTFVIMICILRVYTPLPQSGYFPPLVTPLKIGRDIFFTYVKMGMTWLLQDKILLEIFKDNNKSWPKLCVFSITCSVFVDNSRGHL